MHLLPATSASKAGQAPFPDNAYFYPRNARADPKV